MKLKDVLVVGLATVGIYYLLKKTIRKTATNDVSAKEQSSVTQKPEVNISNDSINKEKSPVVVVAPSVNQQQGAFDVVTWVTQ